MKATLALTSLLLVAASAHPLYDLTPGQDPTLRYNPAVGRETTLRHDYPVEQDLLTLEYDPTLWQEPELGHDFDLEGDPTLIDSDPSLDTSPTPTLKYTPVLVRIDPSLVRKLLPLLTQRLSPQTYRGNRFVDSSQGYYIHRRSKRQANITAGIVRSILDNGGVRSTAALNVGHTSNKHTYSGGVTYDTTKYPGLKPIRNVGVNAGYEYKPNENTAISAGIEHIRGAGDKNTNFNVRLVHIFGRRKKRRREQGQ